MRNQEFMTHAVMMAGRVLMWRSDNITWSSISCSYTRCSLPSSGDFIFQLCLSILTILICTLLARPHSDCTLPGHKDNNTNVNAAGFRWYLNIAAVVGHILLVKICLVSCLMPSWRRKMRPLCWEFHWLAPCLCANIQVTECLYMNTQQSSSPIQPNFIVNICTWTPLWIGNVLTQAFEHWPWISF